MWTVSKWNKGVESKGGVSGWSKRVESPKSSLMFDNAIQS